MEPARRYPIYLDLTDHLCVVVGGSPQGAIRAEDLLNCGARLHVVTPKLLPPWADVIREHGGAIRLFARRFAPEDVDGATLVVAATGLVDVDQQVAEEARARGALATVVEHAGVGDYVEGSQVSRGGLQVCIGPASLPSTLDANLRERVTAAVPEKLGVLATLVDGALSTLRSRYRKYDDRAPRLEALCVEAARRCDDEGVSARDIATWVERITHCEREDCPGDGDCCAFE